MYKNTRSIHIGGNDLLHIDQDEIAFDTWVLDRVEQQRFKLENQIEDLESGLNSNIYVELKDKQIFIYYKQGVTFEIEMAPPSLCYTSNTENKIFFLEKNRELIYSEMALLPTSKFLINFWFSFTRNALNDVLEKYKLN